MRPGLARLRRDFVSQNTETRVSDTGPGFPGSETSYFGQKTLSAVLKFQAKYNIQPSGYVGTLTRAKLNELLQQLPATPPTTPTPATLTPTPTPTPTIIYGDISGDKAVNLSDALMVAQSSLGLITLTSEQITKGDVSGDGKVSAYDAALVLQKIAGIISKFPKE